MSNKGGWFRKYFWDSFAVKILWKDLWLINVGVGVIAATFIPNMLPLQGLPPIGNTVVYGVAFLFITEFVKIVLTIRTDLKKTLDDFQEKIGMTYYKGFYTLLTNLSQKFQTMEEYLRDATRESPLRGVLLDFIVNSLASIGRSGFTMVDASVTDYVMYIMRVVQKSKQITMTCTVRPYWFVVDEIQGVTLSPYIIESNKYGKGEHLRCFKKSLENQAVRYLVIDEPILAEMILTAYIDKYVFGNYKNDCPICQLKAPEECPFHNNRIKLSESIDDIPEIFWFKKDVNNERGVTLIYTLIRHERRRRHVELDDRVYISNPSQMDIRFEFTNLEQGTLRIRWGDQVMPLTPITRFYIKIDPINGEEDSLRGHTFYKVFTDILKDELKPAMQRHLELLEREVDDHFNGSNIKNIRGASSRKIINLLAQGDQALKNIIKNAISKLKIDLGSHALNEIYQDLVNFYNEKGAAKVAYIVTHNPSKPEYPVRVARWKFNWDGDGNNKEGILNAPD